MIRALLALLLVLIAEPSAQSRIGFGGGALLNTQMGIYPYPDNLGNPQDVAAVETWLGAPVSRTINFLSYASWADFNTSSAQGRVASKRGLWSVPLTVTGTTLASVAGGSNDANFLTAATNILASNTADTLPIEIRIGWEFNGCAFTPTCIGFFPWYAIGPNSPSNGAADYVTAFRRVVGIFRGVSSRFIFVWCTQNAQGNGAGGYVDPTPAYPGDDVVDIISQDIYFDSTFDGTDTNSFNFRVYSAGFGLDWSLGYARSRGKIASVSEWGLNYNSSYLPVAMGELLRARQVSNHNYWMSNANFNGQLIANQYPLASAPFIAQFRNNQ